MTTPKTKRCPKGTRKNKDGQCVQAPAEKKPAEKKSKKENKKKSPKRKTVKKTTKASPPVAVAKMNTPPPNLLNHLL